MTKFLTLCDSGYKSKALAMHKSLCDTMTHDDWVLHWLCINPSLFQEVVEMRLKNVVAWDLETLEDLHKAEFDIARNNPATVWGGQYSNFVWTLTPWIMDYFLKSARDGESIMYIDADIYFYQSPELIFDVVGDKSLGIHTHRFSGPYNPNMITGYFNVGVVVFRHDPYGLEMAAKWKNWMLYPNHEYAKQYGQCGDQALISLLYEQYTNNVCVFDWEWDKKYQHLAPWATHDIDGKTMVFAHMSHFTLTEDGYRDNTHNEWHPTREKGVKEFYDKYHKVIRSFE